MLSRLCAQRYDDGSLPPPEAVVSVATFLFGAGQDTTVQLFTAMLRNLAAQPGLEDRLRDNPALIPDFVDEALRIEGTPALIIGETLVPGALPVAQIEQMVAAARQRRR